MSNTKERKFNNGTIPTLFTIIKHTMALATKTELATMFYNTRKAIFLKTALKGLGHK